MLLFWFLWSLRSGGIFSIFTARARKSGQGFNVNTSEKASQTPIFCFAALELVKFRSWGLLGLRAWKIEGSVNQ